MTLTKDQKKRLAARARTLQDRLATPAAETAGDGVGDPDDWLAEWREYVADGDQDLFARRLDLLGLSEAECRRRLGQGGRPRDAPMPDWVHAVDELLAYVLQEGPDAPDGDPPGADEVPFAHVLSVIVEYADRQVDWPDGSTLSDDAVADLRRWLLDRLSDRCAHPLFIEFKTFLAERDRELALGADPDVPEDADSHYRAFVTDLLDGRLRSFFVEYAVLSKLLVRVVEQWRVAVEEFLERLTADRAALAETFADGEPPGAVASVDVLGDRHAHGRRVFGVTFESGRKVAYKPRPLEPEAAYANLLRWVNTRSTLPDLRPVECLVRDGYGWMEWIESAECTNRDAVARYYRRAGVMLCLLYALNFSDGHLENVIAAGAHPIVVDLETAVQPDFGPEKTPMEAIGREVVEESVLGTSLIPRFLPKADIEKRGGWNEPAAEVDGIEAPVFTDVNTDVMDLEFSSSRTIEGASLPRVDGKPVRPEGYHEDIAEGFEDAYRFLLDERAALLADGGPLDAFGDAEVRVLFRATVTYGKTLVPLETPSYLRTGLQFGCKVERLARPFAEGIVDREMWPVYEAERRALWRLDVPRFQVAATGTDLVHADGTVEDVFDASPLAVVRRKVADLDEADLREQLDYIRLAYAPEQFRDPDPPATVDGRPVSETTVVEDSEPERPVEVAREVFRRIREHADRTPDGDPVWHLREYRISGVYLPRWPDNVYSGRLGLALFAAALASVDGDGRYHEFVDSVLDPTFAEFDSPEPFDGIKPGASLGIGSVVYGFTKLATLLEEDRYVDAARRALGVYSPERIRTDEIIEPHRGAAGFVLGALALYDEARDETALDRAIVAGEHVLENRIDADGSRVWGTVEDGTVRGVPSGVAGIEYALVRLADASGESRFRNAAVESIDHRLDHLGPIVSDYPDVRGRPTDDFMTGWLAGEPGPGFAGLALYEQTGERRFQRGVERSLGAIDAERLGCHDHLYAGNAGRVAFLSRASHTLGEPRHRERARGLADRMARRGDAAGRFTVPWQTDRWYNPTFFTGEAGVAYALLRLQHPELPCVPLWE